MTPSSHVDPTNGAPHTLESGHGALQPRPLPFQPPGSFPPPALSAAPTALALLKALRRRLVPALTLGLTLAATAAAAAWFLQPPPKITARTQLHVALARPSILFPGGNRDDEMFLSRQLYLIKDRFTLNAALNLPGVAELSLVQEQADPLQWLESQINVEMAGPGIIHISLSGDRPAELQTLVKAVTQAYLDNYVNQDSIARENERERLKKVRDQWQKLSEEKRKQLRALKKENGALTDKSMQLVQQIAIEELRVVRTDLTRVHQELRQLRIELGLQPDWGVRYGAALISPPGPGLPVHHLVVAHLDEEALVALAEPSVRPPLDGQRLEELINQDKIVVEGLKQIAAREIEIERNRETANEKAFERIVAPLRQQIADLKKEVETRRQELRPLYEKRYRELVQQEAEAARRTLLRKYTASKQLEKTLIDDAERLDGQIVKIGTGALDINEFEDALEQSEKIRQRADDKLNAMDVEKDAPPRITQPNKEAVLNMPNKAQRKLMVTGGAAGGALALVLLAFAWLEFRSGKVHSPEEVVSGLGLPWMGTVPDLSRRRWRSWWWPGEGDRVYSQMVLTESVDAARTLLLHAARTEPLQIVMITSAVAGEGKTSLASHLAVSLARAGRRTLLLDSDLRNPTLHHLFERSRGPGLSELLRGEVDLAGATRDTPIPNLSLISAGQADTAALQALAFELVPQIFQHLRSQYDFIVVDSCPVLPVADALLVGQYVDAVIFALLRQVSRLPRVYAAYQRLAVLDIRMLGAVVNGTEDDLRPVDYHYTVNPED